MVFHHHVHRNSPSFGNFFPQREKAVLDLAAQIEVENVGRLVSRHRIDKESIA
ncbi:hypothetical protein CH063_04740 [Colletotrichum higginsianum]|uniref:Uncharacterized protein n=1 Tax=Colletotrichum higginsianum (strain IMI 349063) TaxID=759273 RepID=H1UWI5_COLHI|nr:hypothetical protein CH063_04740 [Colletotrichum higginsianum]